MNVQHALLTFFRSPTAAPAIKRILDKDTASRPGTKAPFPTMPSLTDMQLVASQTEPIGWLTNRAVQYGQTRFRFKAAFQCSKVSDANQFQTDSDSRLINAPMELSRQFSEVVQKLKTASIDVDLTPRIRAPAAVAEDDLQPQF
jgi:hypothetical protein